MSTDPPAATPPAPRAPAPVERWRELWRAIAPSVRRAFSARAFLPFLGAWLLLDVAFNLRYPSEEPALWYLLPSVDVVLLFCAFALGQGLGPEGRHRVRLFGVAFLLLVRLVRFGDGFQDRYYSETFHLYTDLPLLPEIVRFAHSTLTGLEFVALLAGLFLGLAAFVVAAYRALAVAQHYLSGKAEFRVFALLTALTTLGGYFLSQHHEYRRLIQVGLGMSALPRLRREISFTWNVQSEHAGRGRLLEDAENLLANTPHGLERLGGRNVLLFLVESYGITVLDRGDFRQRMRTTFTAMETELGARGYSIVSGLLDSPSYGGRSWFAHATLNTAVRTADQLQYDLVVARNPPAMASFFHDAGYRTVLVQPNTTRSSPRGDPYRFDVRYYNAQFDYAGPTYAWATMPDQYVIDFVHQREVAKPTQPLFVQYVLVSSHAPWSELPPLVSDWSKLGNGALFQDLKTRHFPIEWPHFQNASEAYIESIVYDFEVLRAYLRDFIRDDALIIVLGDHQPVPEVSQDSPSYGVPLHVFSRSKALLEPFRKRGYVPGMWPKKRAGTRPGLETFLPDFLRDFSKTGPRPDAGQPPK